MIIKILDRIVFVISIGAMLGLLGAYTAQYIDPNSFFLSSLCGLAYPYILIANIILLLYWIIRLKKKALIQLAVILLGIPTFMSYYGTNGNNSDRKEHDLSILSYNVRYFDIYKWSNEDDTQNRLYDYLNLFDGDIVCIQEFANNEDVLKRQTVIKKLSSYKYNYIDKDMAIFSRIPILDTGKIEFKKDYTSSCIYCDVEIGGKTVRIYSVHLESYKMGPRERQFMKELAEGSGKDFPGGVKSILSRLVNANKNRAKQAEQISEHLKTSPYPVILCGDFNDTPLSYTYRKTKGDLKDSFIEKGRGLGNTYIGEFPSFRIDYILHTPEFETISYSRGSMELSDHYPVMVKLKSTN